MKPSTKLVKIIFIPDQGSYGSYMDALVNYIFSPVARAYGRDFSLCLMTVEDIRLNLSANKKLGQPSIPFFGSYKTEHVCAIMRGKELFSSQDRDRLSHVYRLSTFINAPPPMFNLEPIVKIEDLWHFSTLVDATPDKSICLYQRFGEYPATSPLKIDEYVSMLISRVAILFHLSFELFYARLAIEEALLYELNSAVATPTTSLEFMKKIGERVVQNIRLTMP